VREPDAALRTLLVDALLLLATTRAGRDALRAAGAYEVVRGAHREEREVRVAEQIARLVVLLKGEEAEVEEVDDENAEDDEDEGVVEV
jgi:hypothetical protein